MRLRAANGHLRVAAGRVMGYAITRGLLTRKSVCVRCGGRASDAHHADYARPADVEWLCKPCHKRAHTVGPISIPELADTVPFEEQRALIDLLREREERRRNVRDAFMKVLHAR